MNSHRRPFRIQCYSIVAALFYCLASGCGGDSGHAEYGDLGGGSDLGGGGGSSGVNTDDDEDASQDAGAVDPSPGCAPDEVLQPDAGLCWRRCPVGQDWVTKYCGGQIALMSWLTAIAACQITDLAYHTATRDEMISLLENCDAYVLEHKSEGLCDNCEASRTCGDMFDGQVYWQAYWTSSFGDIDADTDPDPWVVSFNVGTVFSPQSQEETYAALCVRRLD